jgi:hypothetical protein
MKLAAAALVLGVLLAWKGLSFAFTWARDYMASP